MTARDVLSMLDLAMDGGDARATRGRIDGMGRPPTELDEVVVRAALERAAGRVRVAAELLHVPEATLRRALRGRLAHLRALVPAPVRGRPRAAVDAPAVRRARRGATAAEAAEALGVSVRTVFRLSETDKKRRT